MWKLEGLPNTTFLALIAGAALAAAAPRSSSYNASGSQPDYVIIGGGPAGFVLAEELSQNPRTTVVLLEAGPDTAGEEDIDIPGYSPNLLYTQYMWNYTSQPDPNLEGNAPTLEQGRGFGGGSAVNYLGACRGAPSVFDEWADISGDDGLRWENFLNDYKSTVHYQEVPLDYDPHINPSAYGDGPLELTAPLENLGIVLELINSFISVLKLPWVDLNDGTGLGVATSTNVIRASNRTRDFAPQAFGWQLAGRPNAQQLSNAEVTKIGFKGTRAVSVTYVNPIDNSTNTLYPKEIIVSAGALNSPKLLMLSGVGPGDHLRSLNIPVVADIPQLGKNLRDHHCAFMSFEVTSQVETLWQYTQNATFAALAEEEYINNSSGPLSVPNGAAFAIYRAPDSVFEAVDDTFHTSLPADRGQLLFQYSTSTFQATTPNVSIVSPFVGLVQPQDSGYMLLASADYRDAPLVYSNYYGSAGDKAAILHGYKRIRELFSDPSITPLLMGTVALGTVVEGKTWRIKGLDGIRVVDSSTFPYPPTCHPMATVYAYAQHAAQLIREQDR
ncbi:hypothetical protein EPUS_09287 [Endocarpon pusillum Z07020]|uniref:Glucose-methanol-choline oxidoreductase N-terminal domain-containing protein n=1 Tax=Endocarpon pusillum (strain Z07020 / HMAS-L-300199) TaxID=1263415 RepID=U1GND1_ENDPU|nr:uncharacterized protein EPUS_09287 [Endocarpon pusillum Z07020]ERF73793.1 hypothetical protein EPUS_09287 [Endocarpon pusillum Z07020]